MTPTPDAQLLFLSKLQRLFNEGDFTATYKYALLIALADLSVELGKDDGDTLRLTHHQIADKFVELYWQQATPYRCGGMETGVLLQNSGAQAAVVTAILEFRRHNPVTTAYAAKASVPAYKQLITVVAQTVAAQPVNYIQNLGGQTDTFLFERERGCVVLKTGVMYCLRRFQPLVQQLARSHWVGHIKHNRLNQPFLGQTDDLESFLFETPRQALTIISIGLKKLTGSQCFYCGGKVYEADVDHFVPFSLYPRDLMHNFVLAHPSCNVSAPPTPAIY